jgi:hypothetical protein
LPTPDAQLVAGRDRHRFTTDGLSRAGQSTTTDHPATIDHHLVTDELAAAFVPRSAWVERPPQQPVLGQALQDTQVEDRAADPSVAPSHPTRVRAIRFFEVDGAEPAPGRLASTCRSPGTEDGMSHFASRRRAYRDPVPSYSPDWTKDDTSAVSACPVPALTEGAIRCRIVIQPFVGARSDSGPVSSGGLGGHTGEWYGQQALSGHKNDAEIIALHRLCSQKLIPSDTPGTCYVLGTDGPCDSCKAVLTRLRRLFTKLEFKFLYRRQDLKNMTQSEATRYGWPGDKVIQIDGTQFYYHYMEALDAPSPLSEKDLHGVKYVLIRSVSLVTHQKVALKDCHKYLENETPKKLVHVLERIIDTSRFRVDTAVNAWGERRRFGGESSLVAASNTILFFHPIKDGKAAETAALDELEQAEFYRRITNNATPGAFGNWYAPE